MIVVSDTSCVSNLLTVSHAHLLPELFGEIIVPPAVERELRRFHPSLPSFLVVRSPRDKALLARLSSEVDAGEAEAICVGCELRADQLLIDEKKGRKVALREGLAIIGIVGLLVTAKRKGLIGSVSVVLDQLEKEAGFRLAAGVRRGALEAVGEQS